MEKDNQHKRFPGFPREPATNYWPYPRLLNGWWPNLTGSEHKALDYFLRHTWGYNKTADFISYDQFINGIKNKTTGEWVDKGCGIKSRKTLSGAIKGLVKKGFIERITSKGRVTFYQLKFNDGAENEPPVYKVNYGSSKGEPVGSSESKPTIKDITIKDKTIKENDFSSLKELIGAYKRKKMQLKPYFRGNEMRWSQNKWWVIPEGGGKWLEFAGQESEIEWK